MELAGDAIAQQSPCGFSLAWAVLAGRANHQSLYAEVMDIWNSFFPILAELFVSQPVRILPFCQTNPR